MLIQVTGFDVRTHGKEWRNREFSAFNPGSPGIATRSGPIRHSGGPAVDVHHSSRGCAPQSRHPYSGGAPQDNDLRLLLLPLSVDISPLSFQRHGF